jgi:hypothetical protein
LNPEKEILFPHPKVFSFKLVEVKVGGKNTGCKIKKTYI